MIIQFSHNGRELNISSRSPKNGNSYRFDNGSLTSGFRFWNNEPEHKRKFLKHKGWYLGNDGNINPQPIEAELFFWGEWEPQSRFVLTGNAYSGIPALPHAVHTPMFSKRGIGRHNTDPFVFGDHFYYTNCKQKQQGNGFKMLNLPNQSVILFGSEKNRTDFIIDTVFVVDTFEVVSSYHAHPTKYPTLLREATIDFNGGLASWNKLYKGKMYDFNIPYSDQKPFCFVPCKTDCGNTEFERPIIDWKKFGLQKPGAGTVLHEVKQSSDSSFWHNLVDELILQGFSLGIKFEMPINNDEIIFPEYENKTSNAGC